MQLPQPCNPVPPIAAVQLLGAFKGRHRAPWAKLALQRSRRHPACTPYAALSMGGWLRTLRKRVQGKSGNRTSFGHPGRRITDGLLLLNIACFIAQFCSSGRLIIWGAKNNAAISAGQWWRLITPMCLHGGLMHLLTNSYSLNALGPVMESISNRRRFLSIYTAGGIGGSYLSYICCPQSSIGASGAIFGLIGAQIVYILRHRRQLGSTADIALRSLGQVLCVNLAIGLSPGIDNWGHLGGLLGGILAAFLLGPSWHSDQTGLTDTPPVPLFRTKFDKLP